MRISDWSSDVCSSDLGYARGTIAPAPGMAAAVPPLDARTWLEPVDMMGAMATMGAMGGDAHAGHGMTEMPARAQQIGRAQCRERVWQRLSISVVAVSLKKNK